MRVLFLTHRLPYAPNRGDRNRAYHLLKKMSRFAEVSLFSLIHDLEEAAELDRVPFAHDVTSVRVTRMWNYVRGAASLPTSRPLTHRLLDAPRIHSLLADLVAKRPPDVVVAFCSGMARFALEPPLDALPLVIDMVDVDSAKWEQLAARTRGLRRWIYRREARTLRAFEISAARAAFTTLVVNEKERETLSRIAPNASVRVVQNGIDLETFRPGGPPAASPIVIFCGVMNYYPNEEGVQWFAEEIWPRIRAARPDARFQVVGSSPTRMIRKLARVDPSIEVVGRVPEVQPYLHQAAVSVAPLRLSRGIQTKVIEALAAGLPVILTPQVLGGLPDGVEDGCLTTEEPSAFAAAVVDLLARSPEERRHRASLAHLDGLTWSAQTRALEGILEGAAANHHR
jgi:sugar transferase (PEP-CTERM/EpsH1 system associated)